MTRLIAWKKGRQALLWVALLLAALALALYPTESLEGAREGISLCTNVIIPSLFPFLVISTLVLDFGLAQQLGRLLSPIMRPLFRLNGTCASALVLGFVGGYPVGARTAIELYQTEQCSKTEAERMLAFCNNSGPAFIFGVVGAGLFGGSPYTLLLYFVHIAASLLVGILFRFYGKNGKEKGFTAPTIQVKRLSVAFTDAVKNGFQATLNISAFVLLFAIIVRLLTESGVLPLLTSWLASTLSPFQSGEGWIRAFLIGILELSSGIWALSGLESLPRSLAMAAFMLGWAGLSVHCQTLSFLGDSGLSCRTYLIGKLLHGGLSYVLIRLITMLFPLQESVSGLLVSQVETLALLDGTHTLTTSLVTSFALFVLFLLGAVLSMQKNSGKKRRHMLK